MFQMAIKIRKYCKFCRNSRTLSPTVYKWHVVDSYQLW